MTDIIEIGNIELEINDNDTKTLKNVKLVLGKHYDIRRVEEIPILYDVVDERTNKVIAILNTENKSVWIV